jgi:hypothetical protein
VVDNVIDVRDASSARAPGTTVEVHASMVDGAPMALNIKLAGLAELLTNDPLALLIGMVLDQRGSERTNVSPVVTRMSWRRETRLADRRRARLRRGASRS